MNPRKFRGSVILGFVSLLLLSTSCSQPEEISEPQVGVAESTREVVGTSGRLIPIDSDNVLAAGYDDSSKVMTVQFDNGRIYEYYGVTPELWVAFIAAQPHPWSQIGYPLLVRGEVPYKRVK